MFDACYDQRGTKYIALGKGTVRFCSVSREF